MFVRIKREREEKVLLEYAQENPILNSLVFSLFPGKFIRFFVFSWTQKTKNSKGELKFRESGCLHLLLIFAFGVVGTLKDIVIVQ